VTVTKSISVRNPRRERAAGLVIATGGETGSPFFLLLHHRNGGHWGFPKGKIEAGEAEADAALRETKEETGLAKIHLVPGFRMTSTYRFVRDQEMISKEVIYFLGWVDDDGVTLSSEHMAWCWLPYEAAREKLTYRETRTVLLEARKYLPRQVV
jgi:bis(5'-nucleosidyl)-tetraphosphatase